MRFYNIIIYNIYYQIDKINNNLAFLLVFLQKNVKKVLFYEFFFNRVLKKVKISVIIGGEMRIIASNKKAFHNFFVSDFLEAGIELKGGEIKSVASGKLSLSDSYVVIKNGEALLKNCYIAPTENSSPLDSETKRTRKLLLHKDEILKLERQTLEKGYSIVPTKVYMSKGKAKVEIGLAKGKKLYDKRQVLKDKAIRRDLDRVLKNY